MTDLKVREISKVYGRPGTKHKVSALIDTSFNAAKGEILALLGLNGAGKTTLVKILAGLVIADTGTVRFAGRGVGERRYSGQVGAVFEGNRNIYWRLTPRENLEYFGVLRGLSIREARLRTHELLAQMQLEAKRDVIAAKLSRGMQQRLAIALALVHRPSLLLLDEPTLGVDIENMLAIIGFVRELTAEGVCVILTSHQMDVVNQLADRIGLISSGRLISLESRATFLNQNGQAFYTLELLDELDNERMNRLSDLGVVRQDAEISCRHESLYEVLRVIDPLRINSLSNGNLDLAKVFMYRIKEHKEC